MVEYKYTIEKSPQITLRGVRGRRKSLRSSHFCTLNYLLLLIKKYISIMNVLMPFK